MRFLTRYGADKNRLRNYDLVCDTTSAPACEVVDAIIAAYDDAVADRPDWLAPPLLMLDPRRIYPTRDVAAPAAAELGSAQTEPLSVGYTGNCFFVVAGHRQLSAAIQAGRPLVPAALAAEGEEEVADGQTALEYFAAHATGGVLRTWEATHQITLPRRRCR